MTTNLIRRKSNKSFLVVAGVMVLLLLVASAFVVVTHVARQQDRDSLVQLKNEQLVTLRDAQSKLQPAVNVLGRVQKSTPCRWTGQGGAGFEEGA
jgi:hypothetical protein